MRTKYASASIMIMMPIDVQDRTHLMVCGKSSMMLDDIEVL